MKIIIGSYTNFEKLAHFPKGKNGEGIYIYNFDKKNVIKENIIKEINPAFLYVNNNKLYVIQETIDINGKINIYNLIFLYIIK